MYCPSFRVLKYGVFDSNMAFPKLAVTEPRCVVRYELELFTEDTAGCSYIDGVAYPIKRGLFLCGKPGRMRHSRLPMRCRYVHLLTDDPQMRQMLEQLPDACMLSQIETLSALYNELSAIAISDALEDRLHVQSVVAALVAQVFQQTRTELAADAWIRPSHRARLMECDAFIRSHLDTPLTLQKLARRAGFSQSHFHRIFTAFFGKTLHAHILDCRIAAAKAALQTDECELVELAAACGFSSQSHFSAQFKKATGQTPSQYRRQMLSRLEL